jgi:hypothetical protein
MQKKNLQNCPNIFDAQTREYSNIGKQMHAVFCDISVHPFLTTERRGFYIFVLHGCFTMDMTFE